MFQTLFSKISKDVARYINSFGGNGRASNTSLIFSASRSFPSLASIFETYLNIEPRASHLLNRQHATAANYIETSFQYRDLLDLLFYGMHSKQNNTHYDLSLI